MKIKITDKQTHDFKVCITGADLEAYGNELEGHPDDDGILATGTIRKKNHTTVLISLTLKGVMLYPCARCLTPVPFNIDLNYEDEDELEDGQDTVDLVPFVEECLFIHEPYRVLCDETCKGLCPDCGVNLNQGECQCEHEDFIDPRLEALKQLL